jgi:hypothetical protein
MNASDALSDTPHIVLYLLSAWCAARGFATSRAAWWGGCGALGGLAFWVRPEGLEAPLAGGFLLVAALVLRLAPPRATLRSVGALAGGVAVLLLPYVFLAGKFTSKQLPFAKREAAPMYVVTESQAAARPPADAAIAPVAPAKAVVSPRVAMRVASKGTVTFVKNMVWGFRFAFLPMYLLGNWEMLRRRVPRWTIALAACIGGLHIGVLYMVFFISGYIDQRHVMECVAIALPFAALGIFYTSEIIHRFVLRSVPQASIAAAVTFLACATVTPRGLMPMNIDLQPAFDSAAWIRERARPGDAVISNTPYVPFFGELPWARLEPKVASIEAAIADGPADVRYNFAVLDLEIEGFKELWRVQIEREFAEVLRLSSPIPGTPSPKLIVYQRRPDAELRVGAASSGAKH